MANMIHLHFLVLRKDYLVRFFQHRTCTELLLIDTLIHCMEGAI